MPFSIEYCHAPIAVMTEITEKTPMSDAEHCERGAQLVRAQGRPRHLNDFTK